MVTKTTCAGLAITWLYLLRNSAKRTPSWRNIDQELFGISLLVTLISANFADGFGVCIPQHCPWLLTTFQLGIVSRPRREMFILMLRSRRRMVSDLSSTFLDYVIYYIRCAQAFVTQQKSWQHTRSPSIIIPWIDNERHFWD
jgi:hypothetical protein